MQHAVKIAPAVPQIVAVGKLAEIKRKVLSAHRVELADESALHDGPEAFDGVGAIMSHSCQGILPSRSYDPKSLLEELLGAELRVAQRNTRGEQKCRHIGDSVFVVGHRIASRSCNRASKYFRKITIGAARTALFEANRNMGVLADLHAAGEKFAMNRCHRPLLPVIARNHGEYKCSIYRCQALKRTGP